MLLPLLQVPTVLFAHWMQALVDLHGADEGKGGTLTDAEVHIIRGDRVVAPCLPKMPQPLLFLFTPPSLPSWHLPPKTLAES